MDPLQVVLYLLAHQIWNRVDHLHQDPGLIGNLHQKVTTKFITSLLRSSLTQFSDHHVDSIFRAVNEQGWPLLLICGPVLEDIPEKFRKPFSTLLRNTYEKETSNAGALRYSPHAENTFIFVPELGDPEAQIKINEDFKGFHLRARLQFPFNLDPTRIHYIFLGSLKEVFRMFKFDQVRVLKFKTGFVLDGSSKPQFVVEKHELGSRNAAIEFFGFRELSALYKDKFEVLRGRHLFVEGGGPMTRFYDKKGKPIPSTVYKVAATQAEAFNFTFTYFAGDVRSLGQNPNGSWNGFIGNLLEGRADLCTVMSPAFSRLPYVDLTIPYDYSTFGLTVPVPQVHLKWQAVLYVFQSSAWQAIGLSCLFLIPLVYLKVLQRRLEISMPSSSWSSEACYFAVILPYKILLRVSSRYRRGMRGLVGPFLVGMTGLGLVFDTEFMSFLTYPEPETVPTTAAQLLSRSDYTVDYINYGTGHLGDIFLKSSSRSDIQEFLPRLRLIPATQLVNSVMRAAIEGKRVVLTYHMAPLYAASRNLTLYAGIIPIELGEQFVSFHLSMALRRYSKYTEAVSSNVAHLTASGLINKWYKDDLELGRQRGSVWLKTGDRPLYEKLREMALRLTHGSGPAAFTVRHFTFSFICLACGSAIALTCFVIELLWRRQSTVMITPEPTYWSTLLNLRGSRKVQCH